MKQSFLSLILILGLAATLCAQQNSPAGIVVSGQVVDSLNNETIPYATLGIAFAAFPTNVITRLACDEQGKFSAKLQMAATYIFTFQYVGKATLVRTIEIPEGKDKVDIGKVMMSDRNEALGEVTVTAQRPLIKIDVDKITYNLEEDPEARTATVLEMLRKAPMVTVDGDDKVQLKGSDNFRIYLNGKPTAMLSGSSASDVLKSMPASSVKNIEIITDPGAKYDAEGVGGIINIITARNALQGYTATISSGFSSFGGYRGAGYITTKVGRLGLTANYNYVDNRRPWMNYSSTRDQYGSFANTLQQNGRSKNSGRFHIGFIEANYELDSLNLIRLSTNLFSGSSTGKQDVHAAMTPGTESGRPYSYDLLSDSKSGFGSTEANIDFQHSTRRKDELLTLSYRFAREPDNSHSETWLLNEVNYYNNGMYPRRSDNKAQAIEHTAQIDYARPLFADHTLEAGAKYILRPNRSSTHEEINDTLSGEWMPYVLPTHIFKHTQHIYAAYLAYAIRYKKFSYKAGLRAEGTSLSVAFDQAPDMDFSTRYFNIVPNAAIAYTIGMSSQLRFAYNLRIYRPGIWYLNPYVNQTDPQNISYGNPNLSSEKSHGLNLNYSFFMQKFNFNAALGYNIVNNAIEQYTFVNQGTGVNERTYENVGRNRSLSLSLYGRWSPAPLFNLSLNANIFHRSIDNPARELSNSGFYGMMYGNAQFNLPKDFSIGAAAQYATPMIQLQSKSSPYFINLLTLNKSFLNKRLTLSLIAQSPFKQHINMQTTTDDRDFRNLTINKQNVREFRLRISYRFGTFKGNIRQIRRGISNDDTKAGGNSEAVSE
ncbi:MAG: TonB-dependent receptor [Tannerellaceae bacterium]|jgi:outer membrane receptor protein involved in Fe transport|nr:TonB-dependent receptor [Tannerellaceae bacterium]